MRPLRLVARSGTRNSSPPARVRSLARADGARAGRRREDGDMADRLRNATSPYLLQHADNPVDWWQWRDEAFAEARRRDVPVLLSVGYSACHWCHVMAHESFEDEATAALMNEHLVVPIKVDREERPDVDAVYMTATQAMTGQGGWPMTVFLTPDREPFYCGTYFPREHFQQLVTAVARAWRENRDSVDRPGQARSPPRWPRRAAPPSGSRPGCRPAADGCARRSSATPAVDRRWPAATTPGAAGSAARRSSRRRWCSSSCCGIRASARAASGEPGRRRRWRWRPGPPRRWPGAACTTSSAAGSPGTASTPTGSCRTSRRCCTTTRCWPGCTRTGGGGPAATLARRVAEQTCDWMIADLRDRRGRLRARAGRRQRRRGGRVLRLDAGRADRGARRGRRRVRGRGCSP